MTILLLLLATLFLPLYPASALASLLLQGGINGAPAAAPALDPRGRRGLAFKIAVLLGFPVVGAGLVSLALTLDPAGAGLLPLFAVWGGVSAVFYAFRLLSARDGEIWTSHLFASALALVWVGIGAGVAPLGPALGFAVSLLPLVWLLAQLTRRFGIARSGLYPGLCCRMPWFAALLVLAVLTAVAVPLSPAFFALIALVIGGAGAQPPALLLLPALAWLLWTWAGVNLLNGIVWGVPREDLAYQDLSAGEVRRLGGTLAGLCLFGVLLFEVLP